MPQLPFSHWRFGRALARAPDIPGSRNTEHRALRLTVVKAEQARNAPAAEPALQTLLEQVLSSTPIISAAIALGAADGMRCRAKVGATVPDVGTPLYSGIGLSGLCLQTGEVQLSNDTKADSRVDLEACKKLGIRSVLVLPLKVNTAVLGVLELASVNANAFDPLEVARMSGLADELLCFVSEAPAIPDSRRNFAQFRTSNAIPSDIGLREVLEAAYLIHEHGPVPQNILDSVKPEATNPGRKSESTTEVTAVLSPQFGQEYPTGMRWSRTGVAGVAIALIMAGLFFYGYHNDMSANTAMKGRTVQTSNSDPRRNVARNQGGYGQKQKIDRALEGSMTANVQKAVPGINDAVSSADLSRVGSEVAAADSSAGARYANGTGAVQDNSSTMARFAEAAAKGDPVPSGNSDKAISREPALLRTIAKQRNGSKRLRTRAILEHRALSANCTLADGVFHGIIFGPTLGPVSLRDYREIRTKN